MVCLVDNVRIGSDSVIGTGVTRDIPAGSVLAHGHTHIAMLKGLPSGVTIFNPGSISLPKNMLIRTFGFYDGANLSIRNLADGEIINI